MRVRNSWDHTFISILCFGMAKNKTERSPSRFQTLWVLFAIANFNPEGQNKVCNDFQLSFMKAPFEGAHRCSSCTGGIEECCRRKKEANYWIERGEERSKVISTQLKGEKYISNLSELNLSELNGALYLASLSISLLLKDWIISHVS